MTYGISDPVRVGELTTRFTSTGRVSGYQIEVWHDGLNEHRVLSDRDPGVLENKLNAHLSRWSEKYGKQLEREEKVARRQAGLAAAETATAEAEQAIQACRDLLKHTLDFDDRVDWESLKNHTPMVRAPQGTEGIGYDPETGEPVSCHPHSRPPGTAPVYTPPRLSLLDRISSSRRARKEEGAQLAFEQQEKQWQAKLDEVARMDEVRQATLITEQEEWSRQEADYRARQEAANAEVDAFRRSYEQQDGSDGRAIEEHAELVLNASQYPDWVAVDFELGYSADTKTIVVEYRLPLEDSMPTLRGVTYVQSRDEMKESSISSREKTALYEGVLHQIALRTIHELYEADEVSAFDAVVFNGWVESIDPATGQLRDGCIMSVQARREEFLALNLAEVEPKACYRALKGVSAAKLATLTPVQPILQLDVGDRRFVESREIAQDLSMDSNLATMDWESFEHLVREIFEQEFVAEGGEVKVTQASRDGGVDAVAFDPDPIRGGKYVIQAKRYTRTVGVAAVRDLYGTVMHEGADRGILVTTSDYGADSVNFAKDKPLTLINGAQLLSLLEKHGHRARIDLNEARTEQADALGSGA
ncbi:MAG: restriction endonuclease [Dehalococcoidia bacterium]|nr:restriction endonuclease [Dehalococcoidia bacterium]MYI85351.1 restriction endonuclease [Dehalococcoidia bacterium]